jgi:hypothetical protein
MKIRSTPESWMQSSTQGQAVPQGDLADMKPPMVPPSLLHIAPPRQLSPTVNEYWHMIGSVTCHVHRLRLSDPNEVDILV